MAQLLLLSAIGEHAKDLGAMADLAFKDNMTAIGRP